jgi:hypothetical protein
MKKMRKKKNQIRINLLCCICLMSLVLQAKDIDHLVNNALQFAQQQLTNTVNGIGSASKFPRSTLSDGSWKYKDSGSWTSGFFPGCLWYMYQLTSEEKWKTWAEQWTNAIEGEKNDTGSHDVGFMIFCSFGNGYRLTSKSSYIDVIITGAQSLSMRYNANVGCTRSWNNRTFPVIIDNMMNLEILLWASKNGGKSEFYDMAVSHSLKTIENHVREDGSTYQIVDFNPTTGQVIKRETHQGYTDESTWSRGQAWGLYGFTMVYRETGNTQFLDAAKKLANYYIDNLPEDHVPYWDFDAPNIPNEEKDVSSAAIAVSGLLELSTLVTDSDEKEKYYNAACEILESLCSLNYLAQGTNSSGILLHGVGNRNKNSEVDVSLIYADYYFIEALARYNEIKTSILAYKNQNNIPNSIQLFQNYPNPFNPETMISYSISSSDDVLLQLYNISGQLIQTLFKGFQEAGEHKFWLNGEDLSSGSYLLVLKSGFEAKKIKLLLLR